MVQAVPPQGHVLTTSHAQHVSVSRKRTIKPCWECCRLSWPGNRGELSKILLAGQTAAPLVTRLSEISHTLDKTAQAARMLAGLHCRTTHTAGCASRMVSGIPPVNNTPGILSLTQSHAHTSRACAAHLSAVWANWAHAPEHTRQDAQPQSHTRTPP